MPELFGSDAYAPKEIALKVETVGVAKAHMATLPLVMLGLLAGAFIGSCHRQVGCQPKLCPQPALERFGVLLGPHLGGNCGRRAVHR